MEMTESGAKQSEDLDLHWVEKLFPPRFTLRDLLEGQYRSTEEARLGWTTPAPSNTPRSDRTDLRRKIYTDVLREIQEKEEKIRRSSLTKRITGDDHFTDDAESRGSRQTPLPDGRISKEETCLWNEGDVSSLRAAVTELQRDRWRFREQLKSEREQRKKLQVHLEKCEELLHCSRKEAARHALAVKALKMEVYQKDRQLQKFAKQSQEKVEEVDGLRAELRRTKKRYWQIKQEFSELDWEMERGKGQQKIEGGPGSYSEGCGGEPHPDSLSLGAPSSSL